MIKRVKTNDGFQYTKLSPQEMEARGILGRLVGPCADILNPTRNERKYSEELWEKVFNNPLMKEKIANKVCYGELGHPAERTEIDIEKVAVCLTEQPTKNEKGQLIAVFDILDTPNGRILKRLCDYGSILGISSRGQGDIIQDAQGDEAVDPDTYDCECWDVVLMPGVETARMQYVKESLNTSNVAMKKALKECLNTATEEEKKIMKETLNTLNINLSEETKKKKDEVEIVDDEIEDETADDIEEIEDATSNDTSEADNIEDEQPMEDDVEIENEEAEGIDATVITDIARKLIELLDSVTNKDTEEEIHSAVAGIVEEHPEITSDEWKDLGLELDTEENEENLENSNAKLNDDEESEEDETSETDEAEDNVDEAIDNGSQQLLNSLQEALRSKSSLENEFKQLQEKLAVSDTKVNDLKEDCAKYKDAVTRLAVLAKQNKDLQSNVTSLQESVKEKDIVIESQKQRLSRLVTSKKEAVIESSSLTESIKSKTTEVTALNESIKKLKESYKKDITKLNEELTTAKTEANSKIKALEESIQKTTSTKESYKKLATNTMNKYIEIKANLIGLTSSDVKRKLGESYTITDVDSVCEDLKSYQLNVSRLPFSVDKKVGIKVNEAISKNILNQARTRVFEDDDVDDDLMRLANL